MRFRSPQFNGQVVLLGLLVVLAGLVGRLIYISEHDGPKLLAMADQQQRSVTPIQHRRGLIVDCRGRMIAGTMLRKSVFADPQVIPEAPGERGGVRRRGGAAGEPVLSRAEVSRRLGQILGADPAEIASDLDACQHRFLVLRRGVSDLQASQLREESIRGIGLFDEPYRAYPMMGLAAALVGFVAADGHGVSGLEFQCEEWLRGENGIKTIVRDASRRAIWLAERGYQPARDGCHVVLTIDAEIQEHVEKALEECLARYQAQSAVGVVMHPSTGAILAMANVPGFDPNRYQDYGAARYRNRAITDPYEPGSTFKPFIAAAALAEREARLGESIYCENGLWTDGSRSLHDHHPYGHLSFEDIVIKSSNIGMAKLGKRLGNERLHQYVRAFGFGERSGIDLAGEDPGIVQPFSRWTAFSTTSIPMGQEIAVTPLQLARAFCAFANGGRLVQPYVIRAVLDPAGRLVNDFASPPPIRQAIPEAIAGIMKERVLAEVVERGTGRPARLSSYRAFGKTGTAQIARRNGGGFEPDAYVSSFVVAAPYRDPQLVVLVAVTRPKKSIGYYGGTVAAPVARDILSHALAYLQITPERSEARPAASLAAAPSGD